jgi:hypothetical protein
MKKIVFSLAMIATAFGAAAQSEKYQKAMAANLAKMATAASSADFQSLSAGFERIAVAEKDQWLAYYYAAETQILNGLMQKEMTGNDAIADKAEALMNIADSLQKNNSEVSCLRSMIGTLRMLVNPMQRYMQFAQQINGSLETAKKQDPSNPRPYYLQGQNLKNTPEQFGGGCKTAKPILEQAISLYGAFKPASPLHPSWGKEQTAELLAQCK